MYCTSYEFVANGFASHLRETEKSLQDFTDRIADKGAPAALLPLTLSTKIFLHIIPEKFLTYKDL